jgi:hypothetical protein
MLVKKTLMTGMLMLSASLPLMANALTIENKSQFDSASEINGGWCTSFWGSLGITKAGTSNTIDPGFVNMLCAANMNNCTAVVYPNTSCTPGTAIGIVHFSTTAGFLDANTSRIVEGTDANGTKDPFKITLLY